MTLSPLVDTHAHLDDPGCAATGTGCSAGRGDAGVVQMVAIGTTAADARRSSSCRRRIAGSSPPSASIPTRRPRRPKPTGTAIVRLPAQPEVVAIGETGLDRYWDRTPFDVQQEWFARHLELAHRLDRPVVIHCRDCTRDLIEQLQSPGPAGPRGPALVHRHLGRRPGVPRPGPAPLVRRHAHLHQQGARRPPRRRRPRPPRPHPRRDRQPLPEPSSVPRQDQRAGAGGRDRRPPGRGPRPGSPTSSRGSRPTTRARLFGLPADATLKF